jgi:hypothetical protein
MKRFIALIAAIAMFAGCATLSSILLPEPASTVPVCVVEYVKVAPGVEIGLDGCSNAWIRYSVADSIYVCEILSDDESSMIPIPCPAVGDTLGD